MEPELTWLSEAVEDAELTEAVTKAEDDGDHPASDYAYVPDPKQSSTWKLRIDDATHVGGAVAALGPKGYRGQKLSIPAADRGAVKAKVRAAWKKFHPDAKPEDVPDAIKEADATGPSLDDQIRAISDDWADFCRTLASENPWTSTGYSSWPAEVFEDHIVVRAGDDFYSIKFSLDDSGEAIFDVESATKVSRQWVAIEAALGDDDTQWILRPVAEADGGEPDGSTWQVQIIKAGVSKNRRRYKAEVLKEAAPLFEGARTLARSDDDHLFGANKSVEKIVGWLSESKYSAKAKAVVATWNVTAQWLKDMLLEAWKKGKRDLVGLSIVAAGKTKAVRENGTSLVEVESITKVSSVDVVFDPAAGGGLVKLVAAEDPTPGPGKEESDVDPKLIKALQEAEAAVVRAILSSLSEAEVEALKETHPELAEKITEAMALPEPEKKTEPKADPKPEVKPAEQITEAEPEDLVPVAVSDLVVEAALGRTKLPDAIRGRISKRYAGKAFARADLDESIAEAVDTFADLEKEGLVSPESRTKEEQGQVTLDEAERAKAAMDGFFLGKDVEVGGKKVPRYRSLRKMYVDLTGDENVTGMLEECVGGKLGISEADGGRIKIHRLVIPETFEDLREAAGEVELREAISSTTFDQALGDSITRAMLRLYADLNLMTWEPLVDVTPLNDFRTNRRVRVGGYGNLPTVAENGAYTALTSPADEEATYAATKRGGLETISREAILNDDVNVIATIPRRLARAAAQTLHEFVFQFLNANPTIYDSVALFHATHANLGTVALGYTSLRDARIRMRKQADMSSTKRLGLLGKHLWVPLELEEMAIQLTNPENKPGTADNDVNAIRKWGLDYTVVDYWTDADNWYMSADKTQTPLIEVGFVGGAENPTLLVADMPTQGTLFTNDQIRWKIRHEYGGAVVEFRGLDGSVV